MTAREQRRRVLYKCPKSDVAPTKLFDVCRMTDSHQNQHVI
jgi:hypothetical protein